jgi:hypothetical protein
MVFFSKHGDELSGSTKAGHFLQLAVFQGIAYILE